MNENPNSPEILAQEFKETTPKPILPASESNASNSSQTSQPNSTVPPQVQANINLDKEKYKQEIKTPEAKGRLSIKLWLEKVKNKIPLRKILKILLIIFSLMVLCLGSLFVLTLTNLDNSIFKITLTGIITDKITGQNVPNAQILINDQPKGQSDNNGVYSIGGLNIGTINIKIQTEDYQEINENIQINRLFLNYTTRRNFELTPREKAAIEGKVVVDDPEYVFLDERISIDDQVFQLKQDGSFRIEGITVGSQEFNLTSPNYTDFKNEIEVKPGVNLLPDINLEPAGDIEGSLLSYVREDIVSNIEFNIENLSPDQIEIVNDKFKIRDLEPGREYSIRPVAEGYLTRDYRITIKQGKNQLFEFKLVEEGKAIFYKRDPETRIFQFFSSDFDGENIAKLSNFIRNINIQSYFYNSVENKLYFQSDKDRISGGSGTGNIRAIYEIDLETLQETRVTQNTTGLGTLIPNYENKKMVSIARVRIGNVNQNRISVVDFTGDNRTELKTTPSQVNVSLISNDGRYLFIATGTEEDSIISRIEISTKSELNIAQGSGISLFDVSDDGQVVLFANGNIQTNFIDLFVYDFANQEARRLRENYDGLSYMFVKNSKNEFVYSANRNGKNDIFKYVINQNQDNKLTNLSSAEIEDLYQQDNFLYYIISGDLYVLDISKPLSFKVVSSL